ncbi:MAG: hypothetical protein WDM94_07545 [Bauldia sp.]
MTMAIGTTWHGRARGQLLVAQSAAAKAASRPAATRATRNLILAFRPGFQAPADLEAIARHVREMDPTIATYIVPTTSRNSVTRKMAATRPTLVVSNAVMPAFTPLRGHVYQGIVIPKIEEVRRLEAAGLPVPRTALLTPDLKLDPADWGEFVILKPTDRKTSSRGAGIALMRTARVAYRAPEEYPAGHPGRVAPMLVQQFIDTGENITVCRVLTFFGEPLYAMVDRAADRRAPLTAPDAEIEATVIASQAAVRHESYFVQEERILALARAAAAVVPEAPLKGIDIVREAASGKLYVLELNMGGNTWHFSSGQQARERALNGREFEMRRHAQFDAFRTAARVLVARTRAEAV